MFGCLRASFFSLFVWEMCQPQSAENVVRHIILSHCLHGTFVFSTLVSMQYTVSTIKCTNHPLCWKKRKVSFCCVFLDFPPHEDLENECCFYSLSLAAHWLAAHLGGSAWAKWCFRTFSIRADNDMHTGLWLPRISRLPFILVWCFFFLCKISQQMR